ncbi:uncharacterized protein TrAFT101_005658 [Trichoderma asperellum]|uniref:uncharacterized protein n=1 Tax=Trichoderma asperellum TaxID=101201 RepID=UPI00332C4E7E|nr:hypothetical protein TrAFT101_005658 [Trichoderma asperellum]
MGRGACWPPSLKTIEGLIRVVNQQQQKSPVSIPHQKGVKCRDEKQMKEKRKSRTWEIREEANTIDGGFKIRPDLAETFGWQEVDVCIRTAGGVVERDPS